VKAEVRADAATSADIALVPGSNLVTGERELARELSVDLTSLERDLLTLAAGVYALDIAAQRGPRESAYRSLELEIPVVNEQVFAALRDELEYALYVLSPDNWRLHFRTAAGAPEANLDWPAASGTTLLFSGGLDSLAAAVELMATGTSVQLVSHYTANPVISQSQANLEDYLVDNFGALSRTKVRVGGRSSRGLPFPSDQERETSQRTRSFLFVTLAAIVARRSGHRRVVLMAENGPMAIHLALSTARLGPFSTHTAHPEYLQLAGALFTRLLRVPIDIENPYLYRTKAAVVAPVVQGYREAIPMSVSCWRGSRQAVNHCGVCVPCLMRRISLEYNGYQDDEYARDIFREDISQLEPGDDGRRNLTELAEFAVRWGAARSDAEMTDAFPDIYNQAVDIAQATALYRRFAEEALSVFGRYPNVVNRLS
jgi:7-cyano-7-deazaguanine synthase in queuosine biosynthesis